MTQVLDEELDQDEDGSDLCSDCDDTNPERYPAAAESCDDVDNDCDGEVAVTVAGEVNENQAGTYQLTYTARDSAGHNAAFVARTVTVAMLVPSGISGSVAGLTEALRLSVPVCASPCAAHTVRAHQPIASRQARITLPSARVQRVPCRRFP